MSEEATLVDRPSEQALRVFREHLGARATGSPKTLDRYVVGRELGAGGMGVVFEAHDPELDRTVAIKLLQPGGRGSEQATEARSRLLREAQAIAQLSHPNVVGVYDVGTIARDDADAVFLVMELVEGSDAAQWLRAESRPWRAVVELFIAAGRGLAAAHAVGIVHRDFKPANVLVSRTGRVCVADFGLARAIDGAESTVMPSSPTSSGRFQDSLTTTGTVLGTPRYMAPEQHRGDPPDERSDQYSFCVALFEALCGEPPFRGEGLRALVQAKLEQPVVVPRTCRAPKRLCRAVARGLSPHPEDRFPSMSALLAELSAASSGRKGALVGGGFVLAAATGVLALAVGDGGEPTCGAASQRLAGVWDAERRDELQTVWGASDPGHAPVASSGILEGLDAYATRWAAAYASACEQGGTEAEDLFDLRMACLSQRHAALQGLVAVLLEADGIEARALTSVERLPSIESCTDASAMSDAVRPPADPDLAVRVEEVRERLARAKALDDLGMVQDGLDEASAALREAEALEHDPLLAEARLRVGRALESVGRYDDAERELEAVHHFALGIRHDAVAAEAARMLVFLVGVIRSRPDDGLAWGRAASSVMERHGASGRDQAVLRSNLGAVAQTAGRYEDARAHFEEALPLIEGEPNAEQQKAMLKNNLAETMRMLGDYEEAERLMLEVLETRARLLGPDHPDVALAHMNLGNARFRQHRYEEALQGFERALEIRERVFGPDHLEVAAALNNIGLTLDKMVRFEDAREVLERALETYRRALGSESKQVAGAHNNLGLVLTHLELHEEALEHYVLSLGIKERTLGADHADVASSLDNIGLLLREMGRLEEAEDRLRRSLAIKENALGGDHPEVSNTLIWLGNLLEQQNDYARASELFVRALAIRRAAFGDEHVALSSSLVGIGACHLGQGEAEQAVAPLERALRLQEAADEPPSDLAQTQFLLARALVEAGLDRRRALELARIALDVQRRELPGTTPARQREIAAWLARYES